MSCTETRKLLSLYLDGSVNGKQMWEIRRHMAVCPTCHQHYSLLLQTQRAVAGLGRAPVPPDLALRLRLAVSREIARSRQPRWQGWHARWENALNAFMVPATAGAASAIVIFGLLIGLFALPRPLAASRSDVPAWLYTPPELRYAPFDMPGGNFNTDALVVQVDIGTDGRVQDYRILSAPSNMATYMPQLNQMLIFTVFRPATAFGRPTLGSTVLSFSKINVQG
jgi:hypothetical protein